MEVDDETSLVGDVPLPSVVVDVSQKFSTFDESSIICSIFDQTSKCQRQTTNCVSVDQSLSATDFRQTLVFNKSAENEMERNSDEQTSLRGSFDKPTNMLNSCRPANMFDTFHRQNEHASTICRHLSEVSGKNGDVKIVCKDGDIVFAHRSYFE